MTAPALTTAAGAGFCQLGHPAAAHDITGTCLSCPAEGPLAVSEYTPTDARDAAEVRITRLPNGWGARRPQSDAYVSRPLSDVASEDGDSPEAPGRLLFVDPRGSRSSTPDDIAGFLEDVTFESPAAAYAAWLDLPAKWRYLRG